MIEVESHDLVGFISAMVTELGPHNYKSPVVSIEMFTYACHYLYLSCIISSNYTELALILSLVTLSNYFTYCPNCSFINV